MKISRDEWGRLVLTGSAGDPVTFGLLDSEGLMEIQIYDSHHDTAAGAYIDADQRRELIDWLRCD
jgi:hypothetical protein